MLKNLIQFEHLVEGKAIHLLCHADIPISHIKDALVQFMAHCVNIANQAQAEQSSPVEATPEAVVQQPVEG